MKNPTLAANITALRKHFGLKQEAFADRVGASQSSVSKWESRGDMPEARPLGKMAEMARVSIESFIDEPWSQPKRVSQPDIPPTRSADGGEAIPIASLDLSLAMGPGTIIDDFVESEPVIFDAAQLRRITRSPFTRLRVVTGIGTSHEPKFHNSDQFLIDINDRQLSKLDGYYWITYEGAHALKRLRPMGGGRVQIISENPSYEPIVADAGDVRIEGRAVWVARGL